ncbi:MAG: DUF6263 family protein [Kofleriaceae bacterium]
MRTARCLVLLLIAGCGGAPPAPSVPAPVAAAPKPAPDLAAAAPLDERAPVVRMLVPGTAPRKRMRYQLVANTIEYIELDMRMTIGTRFDDPTFAERKTNVAIPTLRTTFKTTVTEVTPSGDARLAFEHVSTELLQDVALAPGPRKAVEAALAELAGMRGTSRVSSRGVPSEITFEAPNATANLARVIDSFRDSMRQMYVPLPEDEVGKGAKWEVTARHAINGMMMDSKLVYELTEASSTTLAVRVETELAASPQDIPLAPGTTGRITALSGKGTGTLRQPMTRVVGTGTNAVTTDAELTVNDGKQTLLATMHMDVVIGMRPGKPPGRP